MSIEHALKQLEIMPETFFRPQFFRQYFQVFNLTAKIIYHIYSSSQVTCEYFSFTLIHNRTQITFYCLLHQHCRPVICLSCLLGLSENTYGGYIKGVRMNTFICMYKKRGILGAWYLGELSNSSKEMQNTASARVPGVVSYEFHGWLFSLKHLCLYKKSSRPTVWNITLKYQCMTCNLNITTSQSLRFSKA